MLLLYGLASIFYASIAIILISPSVRRRLSKVFATALPHHQQYLAPLDGLRGLAALWVASFHCWQWQSPHYSQILRYLPFVSDGNDAVPIFVALSGFLIFRSVTKICSFSELGNYAWRRWLRIYPLYFVTTVVALMVVPIAGLGPQRVLAELLMLRAIGYPVFLNPQAWSLYVEAAFYVVVPLYALMSRRYPLICAILALIALSAYGMHNTREVALYKFFAAGICVSLLFDMFGSKPRPLLGGSIFLVGLGSLVYLYDKQTDVGGIELVFSVICLIYGCLTFFPVAAFLRLLPMRILGTISYSIYLWHSFLIMAGYGIMFSGTGYLAPTRSPISPLLASAWTFPLVYIPALLACAGMSFFLIERPMLALREISFRSSLLSALRRSSDGRW